MVTRIVAKMLDPVRRRIMLMVSRAVLTLIDDGPTLQTVQAKLLGDEVLAGLERFQEYGLTSVPLTGAEALALSLGGNRSHTVIVSVDDRRYRLRGLKSGEVALYDDRGQKIHLTRTGVDANVLGDLDATVTGVTNLTCPQTNISGNVYVGGNLVVAGIGSGDGGPMRLHGGLTNTGGEVKSNGVVLETHPHGGVQSGADNTGAPVTEG